MIDPIKLQKQRNNWKKNVDIEHNDERKKDERKMKETGKYW